MPAFVRFLRVPTRGRRSRLAAVASLAVASSLTLVGSAIAADQVIDYFGGASDFGSLGGEFANPEGVAVNQTGAGPAGRGDVYVVDTGANHTERHDRIQRFARDENGTPAEPHDDTYVFVSAWGADVSTPSGGDQYEICTEAASCKAAVPSAGNGGLDQPAAIAVDQDTGDVYVTDAGNHRVNVYDGAGVFLRSFGYDAVASGPGQVTGPDEQQQLTVKASGGKFSLVFHGEATGGRGVGRTTAGSTTVTSVKPSSGAFAVGQGFSANFEGSIFPLGTVITDVSGTSLTVSEPAQKSYTAANLFGHDLDHDASAAEVEAALEALPSVSGVGGSVEVTGGPGDATGSSPYTIEFGGTLVDRDLSLLAPGHTALTIVSGTATATAVETVKGGAFEVCVPANGDQCRAGADSSGVGGIGASQRGQGIAISPPDGNLSSGLVFVADTGNGRVNRYALDGSSPTSFGEGRFSKQAFGWEQPTQVAIDSRGIVYATNVTLKPDGNGVEHSYIERYDTANVNGEGVDFLAPITQPVLAPMSSPQFNGLAVNLDSDEAGPDTDILYVLSREEKIQQFGPLNSPGLAAPPTAADDEHGGDAQLFGAGGLGLDETDGRLYATASGITGFSAHGVYYFGTPGGPASASIDSFSGVTASSATVHATINPNGPPALRYRFEYSTDEVKWTSTPETVLGVQTSPQSVSITLDPPGAGLQPNTLYYVRVVAKKGFSDPLVTPALTFKTLGAGPIAETTGAPVRSATRAQLSGRVSPRGSATTYFFEYGDQGPCGANPCSSTNPVSAGSGAAMRLVSEEISGLEPGTTYHYRLVAENGQPGSPSLAGSMTVTTRASDAPLAHGDFPGPPGSDRAYEQVNTPDTGGNPIRSALGFSRDGNRALYAISGGTPLSTTGTLTSLFFAERTAAGWETKPISPSRGDLAGANWFPPAGHTDLSAILTGTFGDESNFWRLSPDGTPVKLFESDSTQEYRGWYAAADESPRAILLLRGDLDPAYPAAAAVESLYDVTSGAPKLVSVLPNGKVAICGVPAGSTTAFQQGTNISHQSEGWVTGDGSRAFFLSQGEACASQPQLYVRDLAAGQSKLVSGPVLSGPSCQVAFVRSTADAVFFWTKSRLDAEDTVAAGCGAGPADGDVYRYDLSGGERQCVTCVVDGLDSDVVIDENTFGPQRTIAVAADGSRVYFQSSSAPLIAGASPAPTGSTYRVDVESGELRWIGLGIVPGNLASSSGNGISPDGSKIVFRSSHPGLNALGGQDNGGTQQYYRYDDDDGSLICVSCPQDGSPASASGSTGLLPSFLDPQVGPNQTIIADDGTVAFVTPVPLVLADQNSPGPSGSLASGEDVYEWRDGLLLLVTDGLTSWDSEPQLQGISPSGRDIYFSATAQYTPDAIDGYNRLYDARIGGGIEFPVPPTPCPLEVCQGTPKGAPSESSPSSSSYAGAGNVVEAPVRRCRKGKVRRRGRCVVKKRPHRRAHKTRRASR